MKKLLLLLFLIPNLVMADICKILATKPYDEIGFVTQNIEEVVKKCSKGDILKIELYSSPKGEKIHGSFMKDMIFEAQAKYCNFNKSISYDVAGDNLHLVCSFKKNE